MPPAGWAGRISWQAPDAGCLKTPPIEQLTGIFLARWRHIGMAEDAPGRDGMARQDLATQIGQRCPLRVGKGAIAEFVTGVLQLDPQRATIDIVLSRPVTYPGMPGASGLVHQPVEGAVLVDQIMGADLCHWIAQPGQRFFRGFHTGIMEDEHVGIFTRRPVVEIGRLVIDYLGWGHGNFTGCGSRQFRRL